jgi:prevent-host-death family protein
MRKKGELTGSYSLRVLVIIEWGSLRGPRASFRRSSGDLMKQLKKTKRPVVLTVNGKAAAVVQDAEAYQRRLDIAARALMLRKLFARGSTT